MRRVFTTLALVLMAACATFAHAQDEDADCLACHGNRAALEENLQTEGRSIDELLVNEVDYRRSLHAKQTCAGCHFDYEDFPHDLEEVESIDCSECHEGSVEAYEASAHGKANAEGRNSATCADCHGVHDILPATDRLARLHPLNIYKSCGGCHFGVDVETATIDELMADPLTDDAHAHGILHAGLTTSATCVSCHGGHEIRSKGDPESRVARHNVAGTCGTCHLGILEQFRDSVHELVSEGDEHRGATCTDCHEQHAMTMADDDFRQKTIDACSNCHDERGGSFRSSYHGQRHSLGVAGDVATCNSCHGDHLILPRSSPDSMIHADNIVATCGQCHEGSHPEFTNYIAHADRNDRENFPILYWTFWGMTGLILATLALGVLHALLWLIRATAAGEWKHPKPKKGERYLRRWPHIYVAYHMALMTSVLTLAATGFPLHYSDQPWALSIMNAFGGASAAGWVHRVAAVALVGMVAIFLVHLAFRLFVKREKGIFVGESTLLPRFKDLQDLIGNVRWFLFLGERPKYSRWTYWEKFDFWAVFWGTGVIGLSGLMLWFPEEATKYVPGWMLNVAVIVHGFEALLDIAFIFTVHVFHANLRPDKFPMDTMFMHGKLPEGEYRHERPIEYAELAEKGALDDLVAIEPRQRTRVWAYIIGGCALAVGFFFVGAMIFAVATNGAL
jgi:cytochrome b subunit of formate dehydrogenase